MKEKIVEGKACTQCNVEFQITDKDLEFYEKISPVFHWEKYQIPSPNLCPSCREQQRFSFRNERKLYKRICDASGKEIISVYNPESPCVVYQQDIWWSDSYNPTDYGMEIDFSRSFFEQYRELFLKVPKSSIQNANSIGSEYTNYSHNNRNCYSLVGAWWSEDCYYGYRIFETKDTVDSFDMSKSENNYECLEGSNLYWSKYSQGCTDSSFLEYCRDCINCENCFGCMNLVGKKYCIFNKQYTKEEYEIEVNRLKKSKNLEQEISEFASNQIHRGTSHINCQQVSWDQLINCKNTSDCYHFIDSEEVKYSAFWWWNKVCQDINFADQCELMYYWTNLQKNYMVAFTFLAWNVSESYYITNCMWGSHLFLSTWTKDSQYCILNKQYTKEEYEQLVPKIIEKMKEDSEWWEFFPSSLSPFGYNETVANEHFPLTKEEALKKWCNWSDYEAPFPKVEKIIPAEKLPQNIEDIPDDILNWAIECEVTKKPFRIIKPELEFYRKHNLWIPKRHPDQRHLDRMNLINPRKLYERNCDKCIKEIHSTYHLDCDETVYCEACYKKEIY